MEKNVKSFLHSCQTPYYACFYVILTTHPTLFPSALQRHTHESAHLPNPVGAIQMELNSYGHIPQPPYFQIFIPHYSD